MQFSIGNAYFLYDFADCFIVMVYKRRAGAFAPALLLERTLYLPRTSSKTPVISFSGAAVASETMTIAAQAARKAGSSS